MSSAQADIWNSQHLFVDGLESLSGRLLNNLDNQLISRIFLIGIATKPDTDNPTIILDPDDYGYQKSDFSNVREVADAIYRLDPEAKTIHTHPEVARRRQNGVKRKSLCNAIHHCIQPKAKATNWNTFVSHPVEVAGYDVCIVLQIQEEVFRKYYSLSKRSHIGMGATTDISLLDAAVRQFLRSCEEGLLMPDPGSDLRFMSSNDEGEIIRSAGRNLMYTLAHAAQTRQGYKKIFDNFNIISSLRYEGSEAHGRIIIAREKHPNIQTFITFSSEVSLSSHRAVRKMLELCSRDTSLLSDGGVIYGLGTIKGKYQQSEENLFLIDFDGHYKWTLSHDGSILMNVAFGQPELPRSKLEKDKVLSIINRVLPDMSAHNLEKAWQLILEIMEQKHGTMLVISKQAAKEAERLATQATPIAPIELTPALAKTVSSIDGAILMSTDLVCHALGVILDGSASLNGNPARGARYNSAIRYVEGKTDTLAIVISQDGSIDIIPYLLPQIKRSEIQERMDKLATMAASSEINLKRWYELLQWFDRHKSYISRAEAIAINKDRRTIETLIRATKPELAIFFHDDLPLVELVDPGLFVS